MKAFICDKCGKVVKQVMHITVEPRNVTGHTEQWSDFGINGDYCGECMEKIGEAITGWKRISKK